MNHGRDSIYLNIDADNNVSSERLKMIINRRYSFIRLGHSMRATELEAAIGVAQFEGRKENIAARRRIAKFYTENLADLQDFIQLPYIPKDREHNFMMYPIVLKKEHKRNLVNFLEKRNIETREMVPLINQPIYKKLFGNIENKYPIAQWINKNGFYIGCHPYLNNKEINYIVDTFHEFFNCKRKD